MRMKDLEINTATGKIELDATAYDKPVLVMISEGRAKQTVLPHHGETKVVTHQGKLKRVRFDEGEEF
ncbi:XtrA/YqaO family protein [Salibacterium aidingense]|uniref:XtrA/YqaO family protein n=1 Tax=Salibacterium aidingense TaxID=384933 RepID=UPI00041F74C8|nr:XtrA/YqaO family protein [Salibacterium aidingense]